MADSRFPGGGGWVWGVDNRRGVGVNLLLCILFARKFLKNYTDSGCEGCDPPLQRDASLAPTPEYGDGDGAGRKFS